METQDTAYYDKLVSQSGDGISAAVHRINPRPKDLLPKKAFSGKLKERTAVEIAGGPQEESLASKAKRKLGTLEEGMAKWDRQNPGQSADARAAFKNELIQYSRGESGATANLKSATRGKKSLYDAFTSDYGDISRRRTETEQVQKFNQDVSNLGADIAEKITPAAYIPGFKGVPRGVGKLGAAILNPVGQIEMTRQTLTDPGAAVESLTTKNPLFSPRESTLEEFTEGAAGTAALALPFAPKVGRTLRGLRGKKPPVEAGPKTMPVEPEVVTLPEKLTSTAAGPKTTPQGPIPKVETQQPTVTRMRGKPRTVAPKVEGPVKAEPVAKPGRTMYREASPAEMMSEDYRLPGKFFSDKPALAIGQGENKGVLYEVRFHDTPSSKLVEHKKPGTAVEGVGKEWVVGANQHTASGMAMADIVSITVKSGIKLGPTERLWLQNMEKQGRFEKTTLDNGDVKYTAISKETPPPEPPAVKAEPVTPEAKPATETKFKFGNTQADIPASSEASKAMGAARKSIAKEDVAGDGIDVGGDHVTVRYGIRGDDVEGIRAFLQSQEPFDAKLGKTSKFEPSEHSDGASPIIAPIEAPELTRINAEIAKHGDFTEPTFKEYKPHATIGYVKPEVADKYVGMALTEGKTFRIEEISISDRNGNKQVVKLGTKPREPVARETGGTPKEGEAAVREPGKRDAATVQAEIEALKAERAKSIAEGSKLTRGRGKRLGAVRITPEDLRIAGELGIRYVELGARKFGEWSKRMVEDFGKSIRPHLRDLYKKSHDAAQDALSRLRKYVKGSKPIWRETLEARRIERGRRFARAEAKAKQAGPAEALPAAKSQLGGELPDLEGPEGFKWAEGEQTDLKGHIWNKQGARFTEKLDAAEGLEGIFRNRVPRPHELEAMAKFFPDDVIAGLLDLAERSKPQTLGRRLNKFSTNMALASLRARTIDVAANVVKLAAYVAQNPGRVPAGALIDRFFVGAKEAGRGRERSLFTGGKIKRIIKGAGERWKTEAERTMQGLDFDAMAKYEDNGAVARITGLTDVPFKDFYARQFLDDAAQNFADRGKGSREAIFKQLTEGEDGPLLNTEAAEIQRGAHDWAIRNTFNIENVASRITGALRKAAEASGKPFQGQAKFEVQDMAKFLVNATTRFSRVIGNVALERLNYSPMPGFGPVPGGIVEGAGRLAFSKIAKSPLTPEQGRLVSDLLVKGTVGVGLVKLGEYLWQNGYEFGTPVETKNGTHFMDFGFLDQIGSILSPILYGQTTAAAEDPRLKLTPKQKQDFKWDTNINLLANQPLTTEIQKVVRAKDSPEAFGEFAASTTARNFLPAEMRNWARAQDAYKHNMPMGEVIGGQRRVETHGFWDEIKANIPWLRESLKTPPDKRGVAQIARGGKKRSKGGFGKGF